MKSLQRMVGGGAGRPWSRRNWLVLITRQTSCGWLERAGVSLGSRSGVWNLEAALAEPDGGGPRNMGSEPFFSERPCECRDRLFTVKTDFFLGVEGIVERLRRGLGNLHTDARNAPRACPQKFIREIDQQAWRMGISWGRGYREKPGMANKSRGTGFQPVSIFKY